MKNNIDYMRKYYETHKDKIRNGMMRLVYCECCGKSIMFHKLRTHQRTLKHIHKEYAMKLLNPQADIKHRHKQVNELIVENPTLPSGQQLNP